MESRCGFLSISFSSTTSTSYKLQVKTATALRVPVLDQPYRLLTSCCITGIDRSRRWCLLTNNFAVRRMFFILFTGASTCCPQIAPSAGGPGPPPNTWFLGLTESTLKWHLGWFSRFSTAHGGYVQQTDTDHRISVTIS